MAAGYNFAFNMSIQAPSNANINQIRNTIEQGMKGIKVQFDTKGASAANSEINKLKSNTKDATDKANTFADAVTLKGRSFVAYTVASQAVLKLSGAITNATRDAIKLDKELIKIAQTTRQGTAEIRAQSQAILSISRDYGIAATKVADLVRVLAQTGLSFEQAAKGARILARTELLASFDNLSSTTEGYIAILNSFGQSAEQAARSLEVINSIAKRYAIESGDLVEATKRAGGAFKAAGGNFEEFAALITTVRSTTRESTETIATAFRTIFARLQRPKTIDYFKELGIELSTLDGKFVGPVEAILRINDGLEKLGITAGSLKFAEVVEQIGGIRQFSKVVPLLTQREKIQRALNDAQNASAESAEDVAKAQQSLSFQLAQLTADFRSLIFEISQTDSFKLIATIFIEGAQAAIELTRALKPLIPLLTVVAGIKIGSSFAKAFGSIRSGRLGGFNRGGYVPGQGNSDTVPAMLTPGEFVIRKSAVQAFGAENLARINKYAKGGKTKADDLVSKSLQRKIVRDKINLQDNLASKDLQFNANDEFAGQITRKKYNSKIPPGFSNAGKQLKPKDFEKFVARQNGALSGLAKSGTAALDIVSGKKIIEVKRTKEKVGANIIRDKTIRALIDGQLGGASSINFTEDKDTKTLKPVQVAEPNNKPLTEKQALSLGLKKKQQRGTRTGKARGGGITGTDTVPALLTPGEFVINKKSAQAYGYSNLGKINKYAKGGRVQRFQDGGTVLGPGRGEAAGLGVDLSATIREYAKSIGESEETVVFFTKQLKEAGGDLKKVEKTLERLSKQSTAESARKGNISEKKRESIFKKQQGILQQQSGARAFTPVAQPGGPLDKGGVDTKKLQKGLDKAGEKAEGLGAKFAKVDPLVLLLGLQTAIGLAEQFGIEVNKSAQEAGGANAAFAAAALAFGGKIKDAGAALTKAVSAGGKGFTNIVRSFGGKILGTIGKFLTGPLGFGLLITELVNFAVGAFFTTDFDKLSKKAIENGNALEAGANAQRAYNQQLLNSIPLIGGIANAFDEFLGGFLGRAFAFITGNTDASNTQRRLAELQATNVANAKTFESLQRDLVEAVKGRGGETREDRARNITRIFGRINNTIKRIELLQDKEVKSIQRRIRTAQKNEIGGIGGTFVRGVKRGLGFELAPEKITKDIKRLTEINKEINEQNSKAFQDSLAAATQGLASFAGALILTGSSIEQVENKLKSQFSEDILQKVIGGATDPNKLEEIQKETTDRRDKLTKIQQRLAKGEIAQGDEAFFQLILEQRRIQLLQAEEIEKSVLALKSNIIKIQEQKRRLDQLNASYREAAAALKVFNAELGSFEAKVRNFEASLDLLNRPAGPLSQSGVRRAFGNDDLRGGFDDIRRAGATGRLVQAGFQFGGQQIGGQLEFATKFQSGLSDLLSGGFKDGLQDLLEAAVDKVGSGELDITSLEQLAAQADSLLKEAIFGSANAQVPKEFQSRFKEFSEEFAKALTEGGNLQKLQELADKFTGEIGGDALKVIQGILDKQAQGLAELGKAYLKLNQIQLDFIKKQADQARNAQLALDDIESRRIDALASIPGLFSEEEISEKRQELARKQQKQALERFGGGAVATVEEAEKQAAKTRRKLNEITKKITDRREQEAKRELEEIEARRTGKPRPKPSLPTDFASGQKAQKEAADEINTRNKLRAELEQQIASLQDLQSARKAEIDSIIRETEARREAVQAFRDAVGDILVDFAFGTDESRQDLIEAANLTVAAVQQGSLQGFTGEQRQATLGFLQRFSGIDVALPAFGGKKANEIIGELSATEAVRAGIIRPDQFAKFRDQAAKKALPVDVRIAKALEEKFNKFFEEEKRIQKLINEQQKELVKDEGENNKVFESSVRVFEASVKEFFEKPISVQFEQPKENKTQFEATASATRELADQYKTNRNANGGPKTEKEVERPKLTDLPSFKDKEKIDPVKRLLEIDGPQRKFLDPKTDTIPGVNAPLFDEETFKRLYNTPRSPRQKRFADPIPQGGLQIDKETLDRLFPRGQLQIGPPDSVRGAGGQGAQAPPAKGELLVNTTQQLVLNIPELQKITVDLLNKTALSTISSVLQTFVEQVQNEDAGGQFGNVMASALEKTDAEIINYGGILGGPNARVQ